MWDRIFHLLYIYIRYIMYHFYLSLFLSVCHSVCLCVCLSVCLSVCQGVEKGCIGSEWVKHLKIESKLLLKHLLVLWYRI